MSDDSRHYPTAIIPAKTNLTERFDTLARRIADPVTTLFMLLQHDDPDLRFKAAAELMPYRHRKLKPQDDPTDLGDRQQVNVQINIGPSHESSKQGSLVSSVISPVDPLA